MIRFIPYHKIDRKKYTNRLQSSAQYRYSAELDYLEVCAGKHFGIFCKGDYEAFMPVHYKKKFGLLYVTMPRLCQQLGIYSDEDKPEINEEFLQALHNCFFVRYYAFNENNSFKSKLSAKRNYTLNTASYDEVYRRYSPKLRNKLRKKDNIKSEIKTVTVKVCQNFIIRNFKGIPPKDIAGIMEVLNGLEQVANLDVKAFYVDGQLANLGVFYIGERSVVFLVSSNAVEYKQFAGSPILIDSVIRENIQELDFDFSGSVVPSVEEFFQGFRPEKRKYAYIFNTKKEVSRIVIKRILKIKNAIITPILPKKNSLHFFWQR